MPMTRLGKPLRRKLWNSWQRFKSLRAPGARTAIAGRASGPFDASPRMSFPANPTRESSALVGLIHSDAKMVSGAQTLGISSTAAGASCTRTVADAQLEKHAASLRAGRPDCWTGRSRRPLRGDAASHWFEGSFRAGKPEDVFSCKQRAGLRCEVLLPASDQCDGTGDSGAASQSRTHFS